MIEKVISIDIYNIDILFVVSSKEELKQVIRKHLDKKEAEDAYNVMIRNIGDNTLGRSASLNSGQIVLWVKNADDKGTIAHEIFHIACYIMERSGISLCHESDEAYAYLIGYITNKVNDILDSFCNIPLQQCSIDEQKLSKT